MAIGWRTGGLKQREAPLSSLIDKAAALSSRFAPEAASITLEATRLSFPAREPGAGRVWNIDICTSDDRYVGRTVWRADSGELISTSWSLDYPDPSTGDMTVHQARDLARYHLIAMQLAGRGDAWRVTRAPTRVRELWTIWCQSGRSRYRVQMNGAGRLVSADRLPRA